MNAGSSTAERWPFHPFAFVCQASFWGCFWGVQRVRSRRARRLRQARLVCLALARDRPKRERARAVARGHLARLVWRAAARVRWRAESVGRLLGPARLQDRAARLRAARAALAEPATLLALLAPRPSRARLVQVGLAPGQRLSSSPKTRTSPQRQVLPTTRCAKFFRYPSAERGCGCASPTSTATHR